MSRTVVEQIQPQSAMDGDGVKLMRVFGGVRPERFDPFLLMDDFGSDSAADYIGGFPPHPHRGFTTITYMLEGKMEHTDHMGNVGLLEDGGVQWMTAGKGVIHSEMPKQTEGKMHGFQVWLNLPAKDKLQPAKYEHIDADSMHQYKFEFGEIKAIAGTVKINDEIVTGTIDSGETQAVYLNIGLNAKKSATVTLPSEYNVMLYNYENSIHIGKAFTPAKANTLSRLAGDGEIVMENPGNNKAHVLLLAGIPTKEPIAQHGPFVMNTVDEINQAIQDYQDGKLTD